MVQPIANSYAERAETAPLLRRVVRNMAVVDWIASVYFLIMATALVATRHANWAGSLKDICIDWAVLVVMLVLVRGELVRGAAASTLFPVGIAPPPVLYAVVPGFGPYHELHFEHELQGGFFWGVVLHGVHSAGALKDIFPSLHTGAPTFFAIFAFVHRKHIVFKYTWPILAFCVLQ